MYICTPNENRTRVPRMKILCTNHYTMGAFNNYYSRRLATIVIVIYIINSRTFGTGNITIMFCSSGRTRTDKDITVRRILSPVSLPISPLSRIWLINWLNHKSLCKFFTEVKTINNISKNHNRKDTYIFIIFID